jgi:hypothetical protein
MFSEVGKKSCCVPEFIADSLAPIKLDETILVALITGAVALITGIVSGVLGPGLKLRNELKAQYDKELRTARIEAYRGLWQLQKDLAKHDLPEPLTPQRLKDLSEEMREWYFGGGGLYLSGDSREMYFALKDHIQMIVSEKSEAGLEKVPLDPRSTDNVLESAIELRMALARDVGTRELTALAE